MTFSPDKRSGCLACRLIFSRPREGSTQARFAGLSDWKNTFQEDKHLFSLNILLFKVVRVITQRATRSSGY